MPAERKREAEQGSTDGSVTRSTAQPRQDPVTQAAIGDLLRTHFSKLVEAPLPERLSRLLEELDTQESRRQARGPTNE